MARFGVPARSLAGGRNVIMLRRALILDYESSGVVPTTDDAYNFSMWKGYLSAPYHSAALEWCQRCGSEIALYPHQRACTAADLRAFTDAIQPKVVVPVHGNRWDEHTAGFGNVKRLRDGEQYELS